jgi:hypothetical protein
MSTHDVPGANSLNNDELSMGCWAEHEDGSLIFVQSTENGRVVYMMFDTAANPIIEYRDAMPENGFKETFSWNPKKGDSIRWTWHDKTPFPWERVIKDGARDGLHYASVTDQLSAAAKVARSLRIKSKVLDPGQFDHLVDKVKKGTTSNRVMRAIQAAIKELKT